MANQVHETKRFLPDEKGWRSRCWLAFPSRFRSYTGWRLHCQIPRAKFAKAARAKNFTRRRFCNILYGLIKVNSNLLQYLSNTSWINYKMKLAELSMITQFLINNHIPLQAVRVFLHIIGVNGVFGTSSNLSIFPFSISGRSLLFSLLAVVLDGAQREQKWCNKQCDNCCAPKISFLGEFARQLAVDCLQICHNTGVPCNSASMQDLGAEFVAKGEFVERLLHPRTWSPEGS